MWNLLEYFLLSCYDVTVPLKKYITGMIKWWELCMYMLNCVVHWKDHTGHSQVQTAHTTAGLFCESLFYGGEVKCCLTDRKLWWFCSFLCELLLAFSTGSEVTSHRGVSLFAVMFDLFSLDQMFVSISPQTAFSPNVDPSVCSSPFKLPRPAACKVKADFTVTSCSPEQE